MEQPKNQTDLIIFLLGKWKRDDYQVSFEITVDKLKDISLPESRTLKDNIFTVDFDETKKQWQLTHLIFGYRSNIIEYADNSFTILIDRMYPFLPQVLPEKVEKLKITFIKT